MIHLYEGNGRGKTSIAIGTAIRMIGSGKEVVFAQFMKGNETSEIQVLESFDSVTILRANRQFPFYKNMTEQDKEEITKCHNEILETILHKVETYRLELMEEKSMEQEPQCLIVLDEVTYPVQYGLLDVNLLEKIWKELPANIDLIMTGRGPSEEMKKVSNYWTELRLQKHPYEKGVVARRGIEF